MQLDKMTWPEVETYLKTNKKIIIPVGSTEQHGPNGIIGIDYLTAQSIAIEAGKRTQTIVAPALAYGMALHHMGFPGSAAFKPSTYLQILVELFSSFAKHGFSQIHIVNGHGGNIPTLQAAFSETLNIYPQLSFQLSNWWVLKEVVEYENEHFGKHNGFHATCGEISVSMYSHPEGYSAVREWSFFETPDKYSWPLSPEKFRETFPDGRMGSDPRLANENHGKRLFDIASRSIAAKISFDSEK